MIKSFTIDRANWGSGTLLRPDRAMCCLGHLGAACGVPDVKLRQFGMPIVKWAEEHGYPRTFLETAESFEAGVLASEINDNDKLSRPEKERQLKVLFKSYGIKLTFKGKYRAGTFTPIH